MTCVLNKSLEKDKVLELCRDKREELQHCICNGYCEEYQFDLQVLEKCFYRQPFMSY